MNWVAAITVLLFIKVDRFSCSKYETEYSETAKLTYLPNYNILTDINFKLSQKLSSSTEPSSMDLGLVPSLIYSLPTEFGLNEAKISFTRGFWDSSLWSKSPNNPTSSGFQFHGHFKESHPTLS